MKISNILTISTYWHNAKKAFYIIVLMVATLSVSVLFYIGLTHDVKIASGENQMNMEQKGLETKVSTNNSTVTL